MTTGLTAGKRGMSVLRNTVSVGESAVIDTYLPSDLACGVIGEIQYPGVGFNGIGMKLSDDQAANADE